jgi:hypothetical protein
VRVCPYIFLQAHIYWAENQPLEQQLALGCLTTGDICQTSEKRWLEEWPSLAFAINKLKICVELLLKYNGSLFEKGKGLGPPSRNFFEY